MVLTRNMIIKIEYTISPNYFRRIKNHCLIIKKTTKLTNFTKKQEILIICKKTKGPITKLNHLQ